MSPIKQASRNTNAWRARKRERLAAEVDHLIDDVDILRGPVVDGKRVITFDASQATWEGLELFAKAQNKTLDQVLKGVIARHLVEGAKIRKLK